MRIVIQRVSHASVTIEGHCKSAIGKGILILVGIEEADGQEDIEGMLAYQKRLIDNLKRDNVSLNQKLQDIKK